MIRTVAGAHPQITFIAPVSLGGTIHDLFIDGNNITGHGILTTSNTGAISLCSLSVRDCNNTGLDMDSQTLTCKNSLVEGCGVGVDGHSRDGDYSNVACVDSTTDFQNMGSATKDSLLSSDASADGTNAQASTGVGSNNFELDDSISAYASIVAGTPEAKSGNTTGVTLMDGTTQTDEIGCKPQASAPVGGPPVGTLSMMGLGR
jgi:hypothetical protein